MRWKNNTHNNMYKYGNGGWNEMKSATSTEVDVMKSGFLSLQGFEDGRQA